MALLGFKERFYEKIRNGSKRQTIRKPRKYPIVPGETLYLYTGLRTKHSKKIRQVICKSVCEISISFNNDRIILHIKFLLGPINICVKDLDLFAKQDGFKDWADMKAFWLAEHGIKKGKRKVILTVFKGWLITW